MDAIKQQRRHGHVSPWPVSRHPRLHDHTYPRRTNRYLDQQTLDDLTFLGVAKYSSSVATTFQTPPFVKSHSFDRLSLTLKPFVSKPKQKPSFAMSRWSYILPRLIIIGLISLALWISADSLTRMAIVNSIQNHTGGEVSIGQIRCSLGNQKLYLQEVVIADPNAKNRNLAQADMAYLEFDASALWSRNFIVTDGQTSRLMFGTPQAPVGPKAKTETTAETASSIKVAATPTEKIGQDWLDNLTIPNDDSVSIADLQLTKTSESIANFWKSELPGVASAVARIKNNTANLDQIAQRELNNDNPLRSGWQDNSYVRIDTVASETRDIAKKLNALNLQYVEHLQQLSDAEKVDVELLSKSSSSLNFEENKISQLLLADIHKEVVTESMSLFHWFQNARPEIGKDFLPKHQRGVDIPLKGVKQSPNFLVKQIEINGQGRLLDQHINFSGHARNLSTQPQLLDAPAQFELRAQGKHHVVISCQLDRLGDVPVDTFQIACPGLDLGERLLGNENSLAVTLGASNKVSIQIDLKSTGETVAGTIKLRFTDVALHVDKLNEMAGGKLAALQMNEAVTTIRDFESTIELSGDSYEISFQSKSDLGKQFAISVNQSLKNRNENLINRRLNALATKKQQIAESFQSEIGSELERLNAMILTNRSRLADLKQGTQKQADDLRIQRF